MGPGQWFSRNHDAGAAGDLATFRHRHRHQTRSMPSRTAPPPIDPPAAPMPIILGSPRSGTTLLRLMLDAHPALAIPPETGFLLLPAADDAESFLRALTSYPA